MSTQGSAVLSSRTRSSVSFPSGQKVLADLMLPWDAGGLCRREGLEMEVTMTEEEVLRPLQEPDSASSSFTSAATVFSTCTGRAEQKDTKDLFRFATASFIKTSQRETASCHSQSKVSTAGIDRLVGGTASVPPMDYESQKAAERLWITAVRITTDTLHSSFSCEDILWE